MMYKSFQCITIFVSFSTFCDSGKMISFLMNEHDKHKNCEMSFCFIFFFYEFHINQALSSLNFFPSFVHPVNLMRLHHRLLLTIIEVIFTPLKYLQQNRNKLSSCCFFIYSSFYFCSVYLFD